jgi:hypothetical protein
VLLVCSTRLSEEDWREGMSKVTAALKWADAVPAGTVRWSPDTGVDKIDWALTLLQDANSNFAIANAPWLQVEQQPQPQAPAAE